MWKKHGVIPRKKCKNPWKTELYTKLSTICTKKYHKCGIRKTLSSSKVCFGICDKITKKGVKRKVSSSCDVFGKKKGMQEFASKYAKAGESEELLKK